ncbi:MAG: DUF4157 domain-containing protein [Leptolyngbyaceae cyanobacterium]
MPLSKTSVSNETHLFKGVAGLFCTTKDSSLQHRMGQAMGADFSGVKVHTDSQSDQLNESIQAKAFTTGQDVFFRQGEYAPNSTAGQELIAHELTHVVQQSATGSNAIQRFWGLGKALGLKKKKKRSGNTASGVKVSDYQQTDIPAIKGGVAPSNSAVSPRDWGTNREAPVKYPDLKSRSKRYKGEDKDSREITHVNEIFKTLEELDQQGKLNISIEEALQQDFGWSAKEVKKYYKNKKKTRVKYLDKTSREQYELKGGNPLTQQVTDSDTGKVSQQPFDTSEMFSKVAGKGFGIYVMSPDGSLYSHAHKVGLFHHSSFLAGLPTAGAGEIKVINGAVKKITNKSGHYQPNDKQMAQTLQELRARGVNLSEVELSLVNGPKGISANAQDWLDSPQDRKIAKLYMHVDLDAPKMHLLRQLMSGNVGHAWVSLEWNDANMIPQDLPKAHQKHLKTGEDPFGFWPKKFQWNDYTGLTSDEISDKVIQDNKDEHDYTEQKLRSPEFKKEFEDKHKRALTEKDINDYLAEAIEDDVDTAETWGGLQTDLSNPVGYSTNPFDSYVPGQVLHPDYMHDAKATQTYNLTRAEVDQVLQYADSKKSADYSVLYYNCTHFARGAVKAAGKPAPKAGHAGVCYPDKLFKSIESNFKKGKGVTSLEVNERMVERVGSVLSSRKKKKK